MEHWIEQCLITPGPFAKLSWRNQKSRYGIFSHYMKYYKWWQSRAALRESMMFTGLDPSGVRQLQLLLDRRGLAQVVPISLWADTEVWKCTAGIWLDMSTNLAETLECHLQLCNIIIVAKAFERGQFGHRRWSLAKDADPTEGPGGAEFELKGRQRVALAGKALMAQGARLEFKGAWKHYSEVIQVARWTTTQAYVGDATWSGLEKQLSHADLLATFATNHTSLSLCGGPWNGHGGMSSCPDLEF